MHKNVQCHGPHRWGQKGIERCWFTRLRARLRWQSAVQFLADHSAHGRCLAEATTQPDKTDCPEERTGSRQCEVLSGLVFRRRNPTHRTSDKKLHDRHGKENTGNAYGQKQIRQAKSKSIHANLRAAFRRPLLLYMKRRNNFCDGFKARLGA